MNDFINNQWLNDKLTYEIRPGDTYEKIACEFDITVEYLTIANPCVNPNHLIPGQKLSIPRRQIRSYDDGCLHEVFPGEDACSIAHQYFISINDLSAANLKLDIHNLRPGMVLCIPRSKAACHHYSGPRTYIIEKGDSLYSICKKFDLCPASLAEANQGMDLKDLYPGQSITVPISWAEYIHPSNTVRFSFPPHWRKITDERYEGQDGFFVVAVCCNGIGDLEKICMNNCLQLPGVNHSVHCLPSQLTCCQENTSFFREGCNWSAVILPFSTQQSLNSQYRLFTLIADKNHLQEIVRTIKFF